jgi:TonB family protein
MKSCPRCGKQYPDAEVFCEADGSALSAAAITATEVSATTVMAPGNSEASAGPSPVECPVCGGKAQPGEIICNFCGTRLAPQAPGAAPSRAPGAAGTRLNPENFVPARDRIGPQEMGGETPADTVEEEETGGRRFFSVIGFSIAAMLALVAGAWLALHLSRASGIPPIAEASPSISPSPAVVSGPIVELAKTLAIQATGDAAAATSRGNDALNSIFDSNKTSLVDAYKRALDSDSTLRDGMVVRLHILPDGSVTDASVRVSTMSNPSLDADVVKAMSGWKFAPASGAGADVDYPLILATSPSDLSTIESDLHTKLAALGANEAPEYSSMPSPPSPAEAAATPSALPTTPEVAAVPPLPAGVAPASSPSPSRRRRSPSGVIASAPPPRMSLGTRVTGELHVNRKFRRVVAYTSGGTVTLVGKVFDDNDKLAAARTAGGVSGVTKVVNDLATDEQEWAQKQARIQQELQNAGLVGVTVKVIGSDAYLSGEVKTTLDRDRAVTVAQAAAPVTVRTNLIRVAPGNVFGF